MLHSTEVAARDDGQFEQNYDVVARDIVSRSPRVHAAVTAHSPVYIDEALTRYIAGVGQRVIQGAATLRKHGLTPHPSVRFTVLDTPARNAFALPPNLIFVDRGLLLHLDSEAELAAILALELARLEQPSFAFPLSANEAEELLNELADPLLSLAKTVRKNTPPESVTGTSSLTPDHSVALDISAARAQRDAGHEFADMTTAAAYLIRAGYTSAALPRALTNLRRAQEQLGAITGTDEQSHDDHHALAAARTLPTRYAAGDVPQTGGPFAKALQEGHKDALAAGVVPAQVINREGYLEALEGLAVGPRSSEGVVRNTALFHTPLDFTLECPLNWQLLNQPQFVRCTSPNGEAAVQLHLLSNAGGVRLDDRLQNALGSVPMLEPHWDYASGAPVFTATALTNTAFGPRRARFVVAEHAGRTYALALATRNPVSLSAEIPALEQVAASLRQLSPKDHEAAQPLRLALVRADGTQNLETMASAVGADRTLARVLNASKLDARPPTGSLVKLVR